MVMRETEGGGRGKETGIKETRGGKETGENRNRGVKTEGKHQELTSSH
jgi:hypothetical protein